MKKRSLLYLLGIMGISIQYCSSPQYPVAQKIEISPSTYANRAQEVEKCGSCHENIYNEWKAGTHSNAYIALENHMNHIDTSGFFSDDYQNFVHQNSKSVCLGCHTGKNLFEYQYLNITFEDNPERFLDSLYPKLSKHALPRAFGDSNDLLTGVDCLTCHAQGETVICGYETGSEPSQNPSCNPKQSKFFNSSKSCFACHHWQVSTMEELINIGSYKGEFECLNCHVETNEMGNRNHYFYWRNDSSAKKRPERLNIFNDISYSYEKFGSDKLLKVCWQNLKMPHGFSECGEAMLSLEVMNLNGKLIGTKRLRVNRKRAFKEFKQKHFHEGIETPDFNYLGIPVCDSMKVTTLNSSELILVIKGYKKPQYWSSDKDFKIVYSDSIQININP